MEGDISDFLLYLVVVVSIWENFKGYFQTFMAFCGYKNKSILRRGGV